MPAAGCPVTDWKAMVKWGSAEMSAPIIVGVAQPQRAQCNGSVFNRADVSRRMPRGTIYSVMPAKAGSLHKEAVDRHDLFLGS